MDYRLLKTNHVEILRLFEISDEILILKEPGTWSSELNSNCPFFSRNISVKGYN